MKFGSHPTRVRTNRALARALGVSEAAVRKARREGRISDPGVDGWDVAAARRAWKVNTLPHVGGKRRAARPRSPAVSAQAIASGEMEARRLLHKPTGEVLSFADAQRARELVKLAKESVELRRLDADTCSRAEFLALTFRWFRGIRDRLDRAVGREAPRMAADLGVPEGAMWRRLRTFVRDVETETAERGSTGLLAADADHPGNGGDGAET